MIFKKTGAVFIIASLLSIILCIGSFANVLSPAMSIISEHYGIRLSALAGNDVHFSDSIISSSVGSTFISKIVISSLPDENIGVLLLDGEKVSAGRQLSHGDVRNLVFHPLEDKPSVANFIFGVSSFGHDYTIECTVTMLEKLNFEPTVPKGNKLNLKTFSGIPVSGRLAADDPEGDMVTFEISSYPRKGMLKLCDTDGTFVFLPEACESGNDSFEYIAYDNCGNASECVTVFIEIEKNGDIYEDTAGCEGEYYAVFLKNEDIYGGTSIGDKNYFFPTSYMSEEDFLRLSLASAEKSGIISKTDAPSFYPPLSDAPITLSRAGEILSAIGAPIFPCGSDFVVKSLNKSYMPVISGLCSHRSGEELSPSSALSKAECAEIVVKTFFMAEFV